MKKILLATVLSSLCTFTYAEEVKSTSIPIMSSVSTYSYHCKDTFNNTSIDFKQDISLNNHSPIVQFDIRFYNLKEVNGKTQKQDISQFSIQTPLGVPATLSNITQTNYQNDIIKTGNSIILHPVLGIDNKISVTLCYMQDYLQSIQRVESQNIPVINSISSIQHFSFDDHDNKTKLNLNNYQLEITSHQIKF